MLCGMVWQTGNSGGPDGEFGLSKHPEFIVECVRVPLIAVSVMPASRSIPHTANLAPAITGAFFDLACATP